MSPALTGFRRSMTNLFRQIDGVGARTKWNLRFNALAYQSVQENSVYIISFFLRNGNSSPSRFITRAPSQWAMASIEMTWPVSKPSS